MRLHGVTIKQGYPDDFFDVLRETTGSLTQDDPLVEIGKSNLPALCQATIAIRRLPCDVIGSGLYSQDGRVVCKL
jgi:hypothetical protein